MHAVIATEKREEEGLNAAAIPEKALVAAGALVELLVLDELLSLEAEVVVGSAGEVGVVEEVGEAEGEGVEEEAGREVVGRREARVGRAVVGRAVVTGTTTTGGTTTALVVVAALAAVVAATLTVVPAATGCSLTCLLASPARSKFLGFKGAPRTRGARRAKGSREVARIGGFRRGVDWPAGSEGKGETALPGVTTRWGEGEREGQPAVPGRPSWRKKGKLPDRRSWVGTRSERERAGGEREATYESPYQRVTHTQQGETVRGKDGRGRRRRAVRISTWRDGWRVELLSTRLD